jgi:ankyrin repeat protein
MNPNATDSEGNTAMHFAIKNNSSALVDKLIDCFG